MQKEKIITTTLWSDSTTPTRIIEMSEKDYFEVPKGFFKELFDYMNGNSFHTLVAYFPTFSQDYELTVMYTDNLVERFSLTKKRNEMKELIEQAKREGKCLYHKYNNSWWFPAELELSKSRLKENPARWELADPTRQLEDLKAIVKESQEAVENFEHRIRVSKGEPSSK